MKKSYLLVIFTFLATAICPAAEGILSYTSTDGGFVNGTAGWTFSPTADISVTALGVFNFTTTLQSPLLVGLWDQNGSLLVSSSVTSNSFLLNQTRYESVTPVALSVGQTYHLGAFGTEGATIVLAEVPGSGGSAVTSPEIQIGSAVFNPGAFGSPTTDADGGPGSAFLVPNFQFVDAVPEPSFFALSLLGIALFVKKMKRTNPMV